MDLKELAEQCGIGYLMDPKDELFVGDSLLVLADKIAANARGEKHRRHASKIYRDKDGALFIGMLDDGFLHGSRLTPNGEGNRPPREAVQKT